MDIHVDRDAFFRGLQMVQNVVEPRQTIPILANVLLEAGDETVRVTATDLEVAARVSIPARITQPGTVTLSARKLADILKELPGVPLGLRVQDNAWVALRCGGTSYKLVGLPAEEFPSLGGGEAESWITLEGALLRDMLGRTSYAVSHDENRHALNGVLFQVQGAELRLVATDGHRLALAVRPLGESRPAVSAIVPRKAVQEIARVVGAGETVDLAVSENQFILRMPNFLLTARLIEGTFPNYEQVVPRAQPRRVVLPRVAFTAALRRVAVLAEERTRPVRFTLAPGTLRLAASHPDFGEAEEGIEVEYAGDEVTIGFNSRYVLDALGTQEGERVVLELKDSTSPGVVRGDEGDEGLCVIMPMRL
jgi:DNA polymerase-3 subunit beta